jgi:hypothetical protein
VILDDDASDVITVHTARKIKRKKRRSDGSGPSAADTVTLVSEPQDKIYRVSFHKGTRLDNFDSFPFGYVADE